MLNITNGDTGDAAAGMAHNICSQWQAAEPGQRLSVAYAIEGWVFDVGDSGYVRGTFRAMHEPFTRFTI
jgi:hypothetical protein